MRCLAVFLLGVVVGLAGVCVYHNWNEVQGWFNTAEVEKKDCGTCDKDADCKEGKCATDCPKGKCNKGDVTGDDPRVEPKPVMPPAKD